MSPTLIAQSIRPNERAQPRDGQVAERIAAVERAASVIELLADAESGKTTTEIADHLAVNKGLAFKILTTLSAVGWIYQDSATRRFHLTYRIANLGLRYTAHTRLLDVAAPVIRDLAEQTGELVRLAVAEGGTLTWVLAATGAQRNRLRIDDVYSHDVRLHSHATGKAWLSTFDDKAIRRLLDETGTPKRTTYTVTSIPRLIEELHRIRDLGYALSIEEEEIGIGAIAAPIFAMAPGGAPKCVGTVSVAAPISRMSAREFADLGPTVTETARGLGATWPQSYDGHTSNRFGGYSGEVRT